MDIATIGAAYNGLKIVKDIVTGLAELKIEADSISKINEAARRVGDAQDTLFQLREELFRLQEDNNNLKKQIADQNEWNSRLNNYELVKTAGGAIVYKSIEGTEHYICPSCKEKREIHILQDNRTWSGKFRCVNCDADYPIHPQHPSPTSQAQTKRPRQ